MIFDATAYLTTIAADLKTSHATNFAPGNGSIFDSSDATSKYGLGWMNSAGSVTVMYTVYGDSNLDGTVNGADLTTVLSNYNKIGQSWAQGDFNYDGTVNGADLTIVLSNYNQHLNIGAAVPEPGTLVLLALGLISMLAYAWRKQR